MSDNAQRFVPGDRVRLTVEALEQFPRYRDRLGTVVGMSRDPQFARIRLDGHKTATSWAVSFFEVVQETAPSDAVTTGTTDTTNQRML